MKGLTAMTEATVGMVVQMAEGSRGRNDGAQRQEPWQGGWGGDGGRGEGDSDANDANNGDGVEGMKVVAGEVVVKTAVVTWRLAVMAAMTWRWRRDDG